jgi:hypothetical protein
MTSISELMDADDIVAEMRMERQSFKGSFMLVEGPTDVRRFEKFIDTEICSFVNCWGKSKLLGAVERLNKTGLQDFIALADADFDRIRCTLKIDDNLFYSGGHDFEIDTIHTDVLERYLKEVADPALMATHCTIGDVARKIASGLIPISGAKAANENGDISYPLSEMNWLQCFDGFEMNREKLAYVILKKDNPTRDSVSSLLNTIDEAAKNRDLWQLTNGHDFFAALGACLQSKIGTRNRHQTSAGEVETHIRLALSDTDFKAMRVYEDLTTWQNARSRRLLKRHLH